MANYLSNQIALVHQLCLTVTKSFKCCLWNWWTKLMKHYMPAWYFHRVIVQQWYGRQSWLRKKAFNSSHEPKYGFALNFLQSSWETMAYLNFFLIDRCALHQYGQYCSSKTFVWFKLTMLFFLLDNVTFTVFSRKVYLVEHWFVSMVKGDN